MIPPLKVLQGLESVAPNNRASQREVLNKKEVIISSILKWLFAYSQIGRGPIEWFRLLLCKFSKNPVNATGYDPITWL
jgi:hypothetical protein